jgi:hypothetical protein
VYVGCLYMEVRKLAGSDSCYMHVNQVEYRSGSKNVRITAVRIKEADFFYSCLIPR